MLSFGVRFLLLAIIFLRFIHIVKYINILFLSIAKFCTLYEYTKLCVYVLLLVDTASASCFCSYEKATVNILVEVFLRLTPSDLLHKYLGMKFLGNGIGALILLFPANPCGGDRAHTSYAQAKENHTSGTPVLEGSC